MASDFVAPTNRRDTSCAQCGLPLAGRGIRATVEGRDTMLDVVCRTAERLFIPLAVGGGVRSFEDVRRALRAGADRVAMNSAAIADPELIERCARAFGAQCVVVAIDSKREDGGHRVYSHGGSRPTTLDTIGW
ncbi:MAG: hypothetical protein HYW08_17765, partial [candidate division NC10 bacterium]|nr:hypothetical protein [candidate division NC10 bacterium]